MFATAVPQKSLRILETKVFGYQQTNNNIWTGLVIKNVQELEPH